MSKVYVVQEALKRVGDVFVPQFDLSPAAKYGTVETLLPYGQLSMAPVPMLHALRQKLSNYCDDDWILPVGDPVAIMAAAMIAASYNRGRIRVLKWDARERMYLGVELSLYGNSDIEERT